jgi:hypothetical protein
LDEKCKKLEETLQRVATNTIGYTRKQANKEWFDEECSKQGERGKERRQRSQECLQTSPDKRVALRLSDIGVFRTLVNFTSA